MVGILVLLVVIVLYNYYIYIGFFFWAECSSISSLSAQSIFLDLYIYFLKQITAFSAIRLQISQVL